LPKKIATASTEILREISAAAEAEARLARGRLVESVVEQARTLSLRVNMETLPPMGLAALVSLLVYGSLMLWAGFQIGSGQRRDTAWILRMPSGISIGGLLLGGGLFLGVHAARAFAEGGKKWKKAALIALDMLIAGGIAGRAWDHVVETRKAPETGLLRGNTDGNAYTLSFNALPGVNFTALDAAIWIFLPVWGLRPFRVLR
jgi:hypothetical protein